MRARVAIVGSGPSGFYTAEALLRTDPECQVDMIERLPTPFGLVRGGVAPDHPKIKQVTLTYDRIARLPGYRFLGNVDVGRDVSVAELRSLYDALVFASGTAEDLRLEIPGEDLRGSHGAGEFVGWYNGHPAYREATFDLSHETAVVIGHGNVATDVCRMLLTPTKHLATTDMPSYALEALAASKVRQVHVIGRRGPAQARFTNTELRELGEIEDCNALVYPDDLQLDAASRSELADPRSEILAKNLEIFRRFATGMRSKPKACVFGFRAAPIEIRGEQRVERVIFTRTCLQGKPFALRAKPTGETYEIECGLVFRCIGFRAAPILGVAFDARRGVIPTSEGRVVDNGRAIPGLYAVGWVKRGPSGVIGTNRADSAETVKSLLHDLPQLVRDTRESQADLDSILRERGVCVIDYAGWQLIDAAEAERGRSRGKAREKFTRIPEMLAVVRSLTSH